MVDESEYQQSLKNSHLVRQTDIILAIFMTAIIFLTIFGNCLVIISVPTFPALRTRTNFMLVSLGIADLMVGILVMTVALVYEVMHYWPFSDLLCQAWIVLDVMCCTSSMLHLCVISIDRYVAITLPLQYPTLMTMPKVVLLLDGVWTIRFAIAFLPIHFKLNEDGASRGPAILDPQCFFIVSRGYALSTALITFYFPLVIMSIIYFKIFKIAHAQAKQIYAMAAWQQQTVNIINVSMIEVEQSTLSANPRSAPTMQQKQRKEYKAARTLGLIMGGFCLCWLPFFTIYTVHPFMPTFVASPQVCKVAVWLGYFNSCLNPYLYTFTKDFRKAFQRMLKCKCLPWCR